jgi:D-alanyl-D-alanine carboxypeptidase/D-alanyl-D-alanine-endopeptidase (penicillin-binding protein 4)
MGLSAILRDFPVTAADRDRSPVAGVSVAAKTGTLNFVSALAGYARTGTGRDMAFAIFTADTARRDSVPIEEREQARGAREWARRSRRLQQDLILRWANVHGA